MNREKLEHYRQQLLQLASGVQEVVSDVSEQARQPTGGQSDGGLSNAPMHLADLGTEAYLQELSSTILETEQDMSREISDALRRIGEGTFGTCEECGASIPEERLDAIPYAQYCIQCADSVESAPRANLNVGRPQRPRDTLANQASQGSRSVEGVAHDRKTPDSAVGTAGGGTAVGGLAGTNSGSGDPDEDDLDRATSSGNFALETDVGIQRYSGPSGGAVGGAAGTRA